MEMEWRKKRQIKWKQNLIGMEQKWNGNGMENVGEILFCKMDLEMERNGNGMEMELIISSVWNLCRIEWIVQWNFRQRGMEKEWR